MRRLLPALALVLVLVAAAAPAVQGVERWHGVYRGRVAEAAFVTTDAAGRATEVGVFALASTVQWLPGTPYEDANLWVTVTRYDAEGRRELYAFGYLSGAAVRVDRSLAAAAVRGRVQAYDWVSFSWVTLEVDLAWEATGERVREASREVAHGDGYVAFSQQAGTVRAAAASGSVVLGGENLTPGAAREATLAATQEGELFVHPHNDPD